MSDIQRSPREPGTAAIGEKSWKAAGLIRAIHIDPVYRSVSAIGINPNSLNDHYKHLRCTMVQTVQCFPEHSMYVDEEGLWGDPEFFFRIRGIDEVFAGGGLIVRDPDWQNVDSDGDTDRDATIDPGSFRVDFFSKQTAAAILSPMQKYIIRSSTTMK
jgi:hypothetical protein